ncbi:unnamed protein product [Strongylus vulgaris]|uniref:FeS cluster biogenesis domain-containing protein n=1 Tax=Strongylus vulgaris TaxID=40348 RepID=A0A3P7K7G0_STRVU|nr:unnamed protein product [Strongylus vulgaris]
MRFHVNTQLSSAMLRSTRLAARIAPILSRNYSTSSSLKLLTPEDIRVTERAQQRLKVYTILLWLLLPLMLLPAFRRCNNPSVAAPTTNASTCFQEVLSQGERLRVEVDGGGCSGFEYKIKLDKKLQNDDRLWKRDNVEIVVDEVS